MGADGTQYFLGYMGGYLVFANTPSLCPQTIPVAGEVINGLLFSKIQSSAEFGSIDVEVFYNEVYDGDEVPLPVSVVDGYTYQDYECQRHWEIRSTVSAVNGQPAKEGGLLFINQFVDPKTQKVTQKEGYYVQGGQASGPVADGILAVWTFGCRGRGRMLLPTVISTGVGPVYGTAVGQTGSTNAWSNDTALIVGGSGHAIVTLYGTSISVSTSNVVSVTGFDFSAIPVGATIVGIEATITALQNSGTSASGFNTVNLSGISGSTNQAPPFPSQQFIGTKQTFTIGGVLNLWGVSGGITVAQVQSSSFGVNFSLYCTLTPGTGAVDSVYSATVTVYYRESGIVPSFTYQSTADYATGQPLTQTKVQDMNASAIFSAVRKEVFTMAPGNPSYWQPITPYGTDTNIQPTIINANGCVYEAALGGFTGPIEPLWPTQIGAAVYDGTIVWNCISNGFRNGQTFQLPASPVDGYQYTSGDTCFAITSWISTVSPISGVPSGAGRLQRMKKDTSSSTTGGCISNATIYSSGSNYYAGDIVNISGGGSPSSARISQVDSYGAVESFGIVVPGDGYSVGTNIATTGGTGSGLTININSISTGVTFIAFTEIDYWDGNYQTITNDGSLQILVVCQRAMSAYSSIPPPINVFSDQEFMSGEPLAQGSPNDLQELADNINNAAVRPSFFHTVQTSGTNIPAPVDPVSGYAYTRGECMYVYSINDTGFVQGDTALRVIVVTVNPGDGHVQMQTYYNTGTVSLLTLVAAVFNPNLYVLAYNHLFQKNTALGTLDVYTVASRQTNVVLSQFTVIPSGGTPFPVQPGGGNILPNSNFSLWPQFNSVNGQQIAVPDDWVVSNNTADGYVTANPGIPSGPPEISVGLNVGNEHAAANTQYVSILSLPCPIIPTVKYTYSMVAEVQYPPGGCSGALGCGFIVRCHIQDIDFSNDVYFDIVPLGTSLPITTTTFSGWFIMPDTGDISVTTNSGTATIQNGSLSYTPVYFYIELWNFQPGQGGSGCAGTSACSSVILVDSLQVSPVQG